MSTTVAPVLPELPAIRVPAPPMAPDNVKVPELETVNVPELEVVNVTGLATLIKEVVAISVPPIIVNVPLGLLMLLAFAMERVPVLMVVPPV